MNIATLMAAIGPFLPSLLKLHDRFLDRPTESAAAQTARAIWEKLGSQVAAKAAAQETAIDFANRPEDKDLQASLRVQLKKILDQDPELSEAIDRILQADATVRQASAAPNRPTGNKIEQNVTGDRNQVIGQVSGGHVFGNITGNVVIDQPVSSAMPIPTVDSTSEQSRSVKTILVLAANPKGTDPLRLGEEVREIQIGLERSQYRDRFRIEQRWAVTPKDVRRALLDCQPQIVHFSGHGVGVETPSDPHPSARKFTVESDSIAPEGLMFENESGQPQLVSSEAISSLFGLFADRLECVVLNACYSATQAEAISEHIPYVVGMNRAIGDRAAIEFAIGFYEALLAGRTVEFAYKLGCSAIQMAGIPEHLTPTLKQKQQ
jgi:CHAT domain